MVADAHTGRIGYIGIIARMRAVNIVGRVHTAADALMHRTESMFMVQELISADTVDPAPLEVDVRMLRIASTCGDIWT